MDDENESVISFELNGRNVEVSSPDTARAIDIINNLDKEYVRGACQIGRCGSCMIEMDGKTINSCLLYGFHLSGTKINTIQRWIDEPLMQELIYLSREVAAFQCGFCSSGVLTTIYTAYRDAIHNDELRSSKEKLEDYFLNKLDAHICRCSGYGGIRRLIASLINRLHRQ